MEKNRVAAELVKLAKGLVGEETDIEAVNALKAEVEDIRQRLMDAAVTATSLYSNAGRRNIEVARLAKEIKDALADAAWKLQRLSFTNYTKIMREKGLKP